MGFVFGLGRHASANLGFALQLLEEFFVSPPVLDTDRPGIFDALALALQQSLSAEFRSREADMAGVSY